MQPDPKMLKKIKFFLGAFRNQPARSKWAAGPGDIFNPANGPNSLGCMHHIRKVRDRPLPCQKIRILRDQQESKHFSSKSLWSACRKYPNNCLSITHEYIVQVWTRKFNLWKVTTWEYFLEGIFMDGFLSTFLTKDIHQTLYEKAKVNSSSTAAVS